MYDNSKREYTVFVDNKSLGESLGITQEEIKNIVHSFYSKIQSDNLLGPIFADNMTEDWDHHMEKMCRFWTTVMFGVHAYKGNPLEAHQKISVINKGHFDHWLELFKETLVENCPNNNHVDAFYGRANNMARVMLSALSMKNHADIVPLA